MKLEVILQDNTKHPFMRGMLAHKLIQRGLSFDQAYQIAEDAKSFFQKQAEVTSESLMESVDKLIAAVAVTTHYPPSHPIWAEAEEDCRNYGLCEFQLESTRRAVMKSYSKTWAACNMN